jgi:two-component system, NtrC family, nitrogen regulation sensor histidine kinase NtrY
VDEFSAFSRMPTPVLTLQDIRSLLQETIFLEQMQWGDTIDFIYNTPVEPVLLACDRRLLSQVLLNLLKNACESITESLTESLTESRTEETLTSDEKVPPEKGCIEILMEDNPDSLQIKIIDNGKGLPLGLEGHLTDPYVTTRERGTGLGLAIVDKILKDHHGYIELRNNLDRKGANVVLRFDKKNSMQERRELPLS